MTDLSHPYTLSGFLRMREHSLLPSAYHPGILQLTGPDALDLLHRLSTNNLNSLLPGQAMSTVFTTDKGRVIDHVLVIREEDRLLLLTSPQSEERLESWLKKYTIMENVEYQSMTATIRCNVVTGKTAIASAGSLFGQSLAPGTVVQITTPVGFATAVCVEQFGFQWVYLLMARQDEKVPPLVNMLARSIPALTPEQWELVRMLQGIPLVGRELTGEYNPYEVGLRDSISFTKGCYIGQEVIARLDTYQKIQRHLSCISFPSPPVQPVSLMNDGREVGQITSFSPLALEGKFFALGVIRKEVQPGDLLEAQVADRTIEGRVLSLPVASAEVA